MLGDGNLVLRKSKAEWKAEALLGESRVKEKRSFGSHTSICK